LGLYAAASDETRSDRAEDYKSTFRGAIRFREANFPFLNLLMSDMTATPRWKGVFSKAAASVFFAHHSADH
jgi:hypothetical protein